MKAQRLLVVLIMLGYYRFMLYHFSGRGLWEAIAYTINDVVLSAWFYQFVMA